MGQALLVFSFSKTSVRIRSSNSPSLLTQRVGVRPFHLRSSLSDRYR